MLTVLHELMKKELEVTDKDLFIIIKLTVNLSFSTEKKIKRRRNWKESINPQCMIKNIFYSSIYNE